MGFIKHDDNNTSEMNSGRRTFLGAAAMMAVAGCGADEPEGTGGIGNASVDMIGDQTIDELREEYRADLFDTFLPFMDKHVIDHALGGFMCDARPDGSRVSTEKRAGFTGRGIWIYSHLYNNIAPEQKYLDIAKKSVDFILKSKPRRLDLWPSRYTKDGRVTMTASPSVNSDLYIADGLQEFAKATGDTSYFDLAREILVKCVQVYDGDKYLPGAGRGYLGTDAPLIPGVRLIDDWMLFLWVATQMLRQKSDMDLLMVVSHCLETIVYRFYNEETGLVHEMLERDYSRPKNEIADIVNIGNSIQALWHIMEAAERIDNRDQFMTAAERLFHHIETAWDDVYGGLYTFCYDIDDNRWYLAKTHYVHAEALVGLLKIIEHTGDKRAVDWFDRIRRYQKKTFYLEDRGCPLWLNSTDRWGGFELEKATRIGNFHQPRHLMMNLEALERMTGADTERV